MTLQTTRAWLTIEDFVTGMPKNFLSTIPEQALSRSVPEHDALPLVQCIHAICSLRQHGQHVIHCPSLHCASGVTLSTAKDMPAALRALSRAIAVRERHSVLSV